MKIILTQSELKSSQDILSKSISIAGQLSGKASWEIHKAIQQMTEEMMKDVTFGVNGDIIIEFPEEDVQMGLKMYDVVLTEMEVHLPQMLAIVNMAKATFNMVKVFAYGVDRKLKVVINEYLAAKKPATDEKEETDAAE